MSISSHSFLLSTCVVFICGLNIRSSLAQIVADETLPTPSRVTLDGNTSILDGGTPAGNNLFHSFEEFSVPTGSDAFFNNATTVENILTRVTGDRISNIDGLIRANGTANLFLINPNGIVFGENARLDIGGSFFASTARRLTFSDGSFFSATEPDTPPLLAISVPLGVQLGGSPSPIEIRGTGRLDRFPTENLGLSVLPGRSIAVVGGNVTLNGGLVSAPSGRVEIGSVVEGNVGFNTDWTLDYSGVRELGNVQLLDRSSVFVPTSNIENSPNTGIQIVGRQIALNGSQIATLTQNSQTSGNIDIQGSELLTLGGSIDRFPFSASIETQTDTTATGNGGNLNVTSPQIAINDGARLQTSSFSAGNAGDVTVNADSISIVGVAPSFGFALDLVTLFEQSTHSRISSENFGTGAGGNLQVTANDLFLSEGGQIQSFASSSASGGTITVNTRDLTAVNASPLNPFVVSGIASYTAGAGAGGDIALSTQRATLLNGAQIVSFSLDSGAGGTVNVNASESLTARGVNSVANVIPTGVFSDVLSSGNGGNLNVSTPQLRLSDGGGVTSFTFVQLSGEPLPNAGTGNAGDVSVFADSIELTGVSSLSPENLTQMGSVTFGSGNAGDVYVSTRQISIRDGAVLVSSVVPSVSALGNPLASSGTGNGGRLQIDASESIEVIGNHPFIVAPSFVGTQTFGIGNAGEFVANTERLVLRDSGALGTFTSATGNTGQIRINASEILASGRGDNGFEASSLGANAFEPDESLQQVFFIPNVPTGNIGKVTVQTDRLILRDGGSINIQHDGIGNAGTLEIDASQVVLENDANITATTAFGVGGNVTLNVRDSLQLRDDSQIVLSALGDIGNGGNLSIEAMTIALLDRSQIQANAVRGTGGNIRIVTEGLLNAASTTITASSQLGIDGAIEIVEPDVDSTVGLIQLSQETLDLANQIDRGCANYRGDTFIVSGRGGLPENPTEMLRGTGSWSWVDLRDRLDSDEASLSTESPRALPEIEEIPEPVVEVTGWVRHDDGTVELVAGFPSSVVDIDCYTGREVSVNSIDR
ncbi:MAG: filamentous hemagglutinin N-terminal domain-containing protein [Cyanobacteria bacterium SID2]|nr:filamentous hemagglutinin N-terminal domain-containing protein [Cyanobacteria bacterium SID2]